MFIPENLSDAHLRGVLTCTFLIESNISIVAMVHMVIVTSFETTRTGVQTMRNGQIILKVLQNIAPVGTKIMER